MNRNDFRTSLPADATAVRDGEQWTLVFVRALQHPPENVWRALTDPDELRAWSPFDTDRALDAPGEATLSTVGADEHSAATIRRADAPRLLEYNWDTDVLRWELEPIENGTRLTLRHTMSDRSWLAKVAAGWHICLDVLDRHLAGDPVGRIVGADAKEYWTPLNEHYSRTLGVA